MKSKLFSMLVIGLLLLSPIVGFAQVQSASGNVKPEASAVLNSAEKIQALATTHYKVECFDKDGKLKWVEEFDNLVVTAGLNKLLDAAFKTGLTTPAWYVGLVGATNTYAAGDILSSHAGWAENAHYTGTRQALILGSISGGSVSNTASKAAFAMTGTSNPDTINGAFLCDTNSGTTGTLYGEGNFSSARTVLDGDTLNITITLTLTASDARDFLNEYLEQFAWVKEPCRLNDQTFLYS